MTKYLVSEEKPDGCLLEALLIEIRQDILTRCSKIIDDTRPEANHVMTNNVRIMGLIGEAIALAEDSTRTLDKAFGPSQRAKGGEPRIGVA